MPINLPFPVFGRVYYTASALIGSGTLVKLRNNRTNEIVSDTTTSASEYALDGGNFASGYELTDSLTVYVFSKNAYVESTFLVSSDQHKFDLTLVEVADSTLISYTNIQRVFEELDDATSSDIGARRIVNTIQEAEREIEERTGMKFASTTVTQEIYDYNQYTAWKSPEALEFYGGMSGRNDYFNISVRDRIQLRNRPIISITTLQRNTAGENATDSWETLTEQTGTGGDYVLTEQLKSAGMIDFVKNKPRNGKRAMRITYKYGYDTTPANVRRLTTLLAVKSIVMSKISRSFFDSPHSISLRGIMIDRSQSQKSYMDMINNEIDRLWKSIGEEFRAV